MLLRSRSRTLRILFPLLDILDINFRAHCCWFFLDSRTRLLIRWLLHWKQLRKNMPLIHTKILLPISFRSLLIHVYLTRSVIVFCIGRALPIRHLTDIRNSSRYALGFYFVFSLVNFRSNWLARLVDFPELGKHLPSDSSVLIFASTSWLKAE